MNCLLRELIDCECIGRQGANFESARTGRDMVPKRLERLRRLTGESGAAVYVADSPRARLLGLAGLRGMPQASALLITRCSSIHTFGMRFPIDVLFLDASGGLLAERRRVRPCRMVRHRGAAAALERRSVQPGEPTSRARR